MHRLAIAVVAAALLAGSAWAAPRPSAPPLVEPRSTKPDSVRALEKAREDSLRAIQPHLSGGHALGIGLITTLGPPAVALLTNPPGSDNNIASEASLAIGAAVGVLLGPAVGLSAGGRDDLATRGLAIRAVGYAATLLGLFAVAASFENSSSTTGTTIIASVGLVGAGVSVVSCIHDLAITPSAVGPARHVSVRPLVDEHGRLALRATF